MNSSHKKLDTLESLHDSSRHRITALDIAQLLRIALLILFLLVSVLWLSGTGEARAEGLAAADELALGRAIYETGILPGGAEVSAKRFGKSIVSGSEAACVNCHRPSGMGAVEGDVQVPPITGNYLFAPEGDKHLAVMDPRVSKRFNKAHDPYTDEALAMAIQHGANNAGRVMSDLMPRYDLSDTELKAVTAYLRQLSVEWSPGVTDDTIQFAMVITPEVGPERRKVLIDMMRIAINQKNGSTMTAKRSGRKRQHMVSAAEMVLGTERTWDLSIWELQGAPDSWQDQLDALYQKQPVFALISGISDTTWQPVHDFCEQQKVPCWFPSVKLPVMSQDPYSLYFSGGVALEANVLAQYLTAENKPKKLIQVYRDDDVARSASQALEKALSGSNITVEKRILRAGIPAREELQQVIATFDRGDAVMFWLRPDDIRSLKDIKPGTGVTNYFSAELALGERAPFTKEWKQASQLVYLYELPEKRAANLAYFHAWLNIRKLPLVDEVMQSEAFFALNFLTDTMAEMLNNLYRDYLIERAETMLSKREGGKAEQEARGRLILGREGDMVRRHGEMTADEGSRQKIQRRAGSASKSNGTTIYPRLSLGPGQRFASKGGYIVGFVQDNDDKLVARSAWIVP